MLTSRGLAALLLCAGCALMLYAFVGRHRSHGAPVYPPFRVPSDNPMSMAKVRLGRYLFYDRRLSFNGAIACADCHRQQFAFSDPRPRSVGATGERTTRNAMTLTNVAYNGRYTWADSSLKTLEQQALVPLTQEHPLEMGVSRNPGEVMRRLRDDQRYLSLFADAFPGERDAITLPNAVKAIGSFERTLISLNAPYDRFVAGEDAAMTASAQRGVQLFRSEQLKCVRCHDGFNFRMTNGHRTNDEADDSVAYHNTGLYNFRPVANLLALEGPTLSGTNASAEAGRFKAPTLRNVAVSAPYMHDGSVATLDEVIDIYASGGRVIASGPDAGDGRTSPYKSPLITGFAITRNQKRDLIAFLEALTDRSFLTNPELGDPFDRTH
jgi:cytochrome c peroxidase